MDIMEQAFGGQDRVTQRIIAKKEYKAANGNTAIAEMSVIEEDGNIIDGSCYCHISGIYYTADSYSQAQEYAKQLVKHWDRGDYDWTPCVDSDHDTTDHFAFIYKQNFTWLVNGSEKNTITVDLRTVRFIQSKNESFVDSFEIEKLQIFDMDMGSYSVCKRDQDGEYALIKDGQETKRTIPAETIEAIKAEALQIRNESNEM